jgi:uncharacterized protein (TIGR00730 family)
MEEDKLLKSMCVYCGSADNVNPIYYEAAVKMGKVLVSKGYRLIYGAGKTGLMGAIANSVLVEGGQVIGITPENLNTPQLIHANLTRLEVVPDIHLRKARMSALADAFIALPGGYGTLDEFFETLTWSQIGLHSKPIGLLNINHYYDALIEMVNQARKEKFIYDEHELLFVHDCEPSALLEKLMRFRGPEGLNLWVNRS